MKLSKYFWYSVDLVIFTGLNVFLIWELHARFYGLHVTWLEFIILGLAVFRIANIVSNEQLTKPFREPFVDEKQQHGKMVEVPKKKGFMGAMGSLIYCPSCTGTWIAAIFVYSFVLWPRPVEIIALIFALSGLERIFTMLLGFLKSK
jgi:hypothetical protein